MIYTVAALTALIPYLLLTWFLGSFLKLKSPDIWILRAGLALIGIAAVGIFIWYRTKKEREKKAADPGLASAPAGGDELDALLGEAAAKLASSRLQQGASFGSLPVIFLLGPTGATKTTAIVNSGLDAELLAGQIFQDSAIVPTRSANLWFARKSVFVEASGNLLGDLSAWSRLIRRMQARRLGSLFGKGEQAPRAAVVCLPCDIFLKPGAADNVPSVARTLAARLADVSQLLGINVPVYVLFTKLDRLSFFHEYVRNLIEPEVTEVLGVTLPNAPSQATGVYAEQETARLTAAFNQLFYSLAEKRTRMLSRENEPEKLAGIYEFPREFRKLRTIAMQFLVDLCRPSQLSTGPFLRGFYFCGVRPVIVRDVAAVAAPRPSLSQSAQARGDATGIFQQEQLEFRQSAPQTPVPAATSSRKVPQWVFLNHFFGEVLLTDRAGLGASGSSEKTNTLRRVLLAAAAALCLLLTLAFTISYAGNQSLESDARDAAARIRPLAASGADVASLASVDSLTRLEGLRQSLETLTRYEREGAPLHLRWGLYAGSQIYPDVRKLYFQRFHQLLLIPTQASMVATLKGLAGTSDYEYAYDTLKAYLITTSHHNKSTQAFLSPALTTRWVSGRPVDPEQTRLAKKQFDFYSEELLVDGSTFSTANDAPTIERARAYLSAFAGADRVYPVMLAEANKNNPSLNFNRKFPGASEVVTNNKDVTGAYTKAGWAFMQNAIKNAESFFSREEWVLPPRPGVQKDANLEQDLRARYYSDFINQWQDYLKKSAVVPYRDFADAAKKLSRNAAPQSPLLAMFWLASQNTGVDAPEVLKAFKPLHAVMPPAYVDQYVGPNNADYMSALVTLQLALEQIANLPPASNEQAAEQTRSAAGAAKAVTRQMNLKLLLDPIILKLLEDPITHALGSIPAPPAPGKELCVEFKPLSLKYPFNPSSAVKATPEDLATFFAPKTGVLWSVYEQKLKKSLTPQGTLVPGVTPAPPGGIVRFFKSAAEFSNALYPGGSPTPRLAYSLKPALSDDIQSVHLSIDGQTADFSGSAPAKQFVWPGASPHEARMNIVFKGGSPFNLPPDDGQWAVFDFISEADKYQQTAAGASLEWGLKFGTRPVPSPVNGQPVKVRFELDMLGGPHVFRKGYFPSLTCSESAK